MILDFLNKHTLLFLILPTVEYVCLIIIGRRKENIASGEHKKNNFDLTLFLLQRLLFYWLINSANDFPFKTILNLNIQIIILHIFSVES